MAHSFPTRRSSDLDPLQIEIHGVNAAAARDILPIRKKAHRRIVSEPGLDQASHRRGWIKPAERIVKAKSWCVLRQGRRLI